MHDERPAEQHAPSDPLDHPGSLLNTPKPQPGLKRNYPEFGDLLVRACRATLDTKPPMLLDWGLGDLGERQDELDSDTRRTVKALIRQKGVVTGDQAKTLYLHFIRSDPTVCPNPFDPAGYPIDPGRAMYWLRVAVDHGNTEAIETALTFVRCSVAPMLAQPADTQDDRDIKAATLDRIRLIAERAISVAAIEVRTQPFSAGYLLARVLKTAEEAPGLLDNGLTAQVQLLIRRWDEETTRDPQVAGMLRSFAGLPAPAPEHAAVSEGLSAKPNTSRQAHLVCMRPMEHEELTRRYGALATPMPMAAAPAAAALRQQLDAEFPWLTDITERIVGQIVLRQSAGEAAFWLPPMLLVGPPGSGKTHYVLRLLELAGIPARTLPCAGAADNRALQGTARGWNTAQPSVIAQLIAAEGIANPAIVLDEIDKVSPSRRNGNLWDTLHQLLERRTARTWFDECLQQPCDFSRVSYLATANSLKALPMSLLSRFAIVLAKLPSEQDRMGILEHLLREVAAELGTRPEWLPPLQPEDWAIIHAACGESMRDTKRLLHDLLARRAAQATRPDMLH